MKLLSLSCILVYALLFASPPLHCHGLEASTGHEDHCQGCQYTFASSAVLDKSTVQVPSCDAFGPEVDGTGLCFSQSHTGILGSRAPPVQS